MLMAKYALHQSKSGDVMAKHSQVLFVHMAVKKDDKGQNVFTTFVSYWFNPIELA